MKNLISFTSFSGNLSVLVFFGTDVRKGKSITRPEQLI